jgi:glycosyltransferase involved in cell wall biosynthesis
MTLPRLLVIDDNPDFGGHQVMSAYAIEGIVASGKWQLLSLLHPDNLKNHQRLAAIQTAHPDASFEVGVAATRSRKFQALRRYAERSALRDLSVQIESFKPDLILVVQGNIEQGCSIFRLQGQLPCPLLSYIPVPHRHVEMGAKLGALRDLTCRGLYAVPDGFITISKTLGEMLVAYGARGRIQIVENGIPLERFKNRPPRAECRVKLGLPENAFIWGQMGRVEFKQKGQDFALHSFANRHTAHPEEHLAFLGSGPDSALLEATAAKMSGVTCLAWSDDPTPFLSAIDALILPSRYEGVPLVMLEALANSVPVVATDRDGMRDWLPEAWRFAYRSEVALLRAMDAVCRVDPAVIASLQDRVWKQHTVAAFQSEFIRALQEWL